jgi:ATP-binding cassette, subfamily A (ABC1), member 3
MWKTLAGVVVGRSILLTTHSMEEAGALANRAGIMSKRMLAMGTTEYLRHKHGAAYHCHLVTKTAPHTSDEEMTRIKDWILKRFPDADMETNTYHGQLRFAIPAYSDALKREPTHASSASVPAGDEIVGGSEVPGRIDGSSVGIIISMLEDHRDELSLAYYAVSPTTLDQVFLSIVEKHNVEEENYAVKPGGTYFWNK